MCLFETGLFLDPVFRQTEQHQHQGCGGCGEDSGQSHVSGLHQAEIGISQVDSDEGAHYDQQTITHRAEAPVAHNDIGDISDDRSGDENDENHHHEDIAGIFVELQELKHSRFPNQVCQTADCASTHFMLAACGKKFVDLRVVREGLS